MMTNAQAQQAAKDWEGQAGGRLVPQLTENELAGIVNEATAQAEAALVKELRVARLAIRKMKAQFNQFDEGFSIGRVALSRANKALKPFTQPTAVPIKT